MNKKEVMKQWDNILGYIKSGEHGSLPKDLFEYIIDAYEYEMAQLRTENDRLRTALKDAAKSLQAISVNAGRRNEYMEDFLQVRGYANSRAGVAFKALNEEADSGEGEQMKPEQCTAHHHACDCREYKLTKELAQLHAENSQLRKEAELGKELARHIRNLPTAELDSDALILAHKVLGSETP